MAWNAEPAAFRCDSTAWSRLCSKTTAGTHVNANLDLQTQPADSARDRVERLGVWSKYCYQNDKPHYQLFNT